MALTAYMLKSSDDVIAMWYSPIHYLICMDITHIRSNHFLIIDKQRMFVSIGLMAYVSLI